MQTSSHWCFAVVSAVCGMAFGDELVYFQSEFVPSQSLVLSPGWDSGG